MKLSDLTNGLNFQTPDKSQIPDIDISDVVIDSRQVTPGCLFVAVKGLKADGHDFISQAASLGAAAVLCQYVPDNAPAGLIYMITEDTRGSLALLASNFRDHPERKINLIGITGTKGKTSTTYYLKSILERAGYKTGIIGTTGAYIGNRALDVTYQTSSTPDTLELYEILEIMAGQDVEYCVMEATSHGLEQRRTDGLYFKLGIFTNIQHDHMDYHKTPENYGRAKARLFTQSEKAAANFDDPNKSLVLGNCPVPITYYGIGQGEGCFANNVRLLPDGSHFEIKLNDGNYQMKLGVPGRFSVYNALAAITAALELGVNIKDIQAGLADVSGVRGRFEKVENDSGLCVIVDYAHTPESLENIISAVKEFTAGRVITLFGCGGDRDRGKRPEMGGIAGRLSDICIITSDNPRNENPDSIIADILTGAKGGNSQIFIEPDRKKAIFTAIGMARPGDAVILAGKGHEDYQEFENRRREPFDDKLTALQALKSIGGKA